MPWGGQVSVPERSMYVARRNPSFDREQFISRWRGHWGLVGSMAETSTVRRYIQCEILFDTHPEPRDGIASTEFFSPETRRAIRAATEFRRVAHEDERRVFEGLVGDHMFIARHHVLAGSGTGPFKVVRFVTRRPEVGHAEFLTTWRGEYAERVVASLGAKSLGYAQNHAIEPDISATWGLEADGAEEFWFADAAAARAFLESDRLAAMSDEARLFSDVDAVVTNEVILKDVR